VPLGKDLNTAFIEKTTSVSWLAIASSLAARPWNPGTIESCHFTYALYIQ
jgi:hypothetical protein